MPEMAAGPLSDVARQERRARRAWAKPGSTHDRVIAVARVALPIAVGVLAALLAMAPLTGGHDISFVLSKSRVAMAHERMHLSDATYRGEDNKGEAFSIKAKSAVQATSTNPNVKLQQLSAHIALQSGPGTLVAPSGDYNMKTDQVVMDGPVSYRSSDGYALDTSTVDLDMKTRQLASRAPVTGRMPLGAFSADRMTADLNTHDVVLEGHAHLHIDRRTAKARR